MEVVRSNNKTIVYKMDDGLECEATKDCTKQNVATIYYMCKFLNPKRPKSWLER